MQHMDDAPPRASTVPGNARYPRISPAGMAHIAAATEVIVRERLGDGHAWAQEDGAELRASVSQLQLAAERLHDYPLSNADEPAFVLDLGGVES